MSDYDVDFPRGDDELARRAKDNESLAGEINDLVRLLNGKLREADGRGLRVESEVMIEGRRAGGYEERKRMVVRVYRRHGAIL